MLKALTAGDYIKFVEFTGQALLEGYQCGFLGKKIANGFAKEVNQRVTVERQYEIQKKILHTNPEALLSITSLTEAVVEIGGVMELAQKCKKIEKNQPSNGAELFVICDECGEISRDRKRVLEGKPRECPVSMIADMWNFFGDLQRMPEPNEFENIPQWDREWPRYRLIYYLDHIIKPWSRLDPTWYTMNDKLKKKKHFYKDNPLGQKFKNDIFTPILQVTEELIEMVEEEL